MESTSLTDGSSVDAHQELDMLIHDAYANCIRSFASCKVCAHLPPDSLQLVQDEANRFDIWASNTGSCLDPSLPASLDHRLRNSPGTREMVVLLLRAVRVNLDYASRIFDQDAETLDSLRDQDGSGSASEAQQASSSDKIVHSLSSEALLAVHGLISQLKKLSAAIRRATANEYNVQAVKRRDIDKDGNDMGKDDETWAQQIVNYHFRDKKDGLPGSTDEMRNILSTGLSFRMRRFRDWKRHFEKQQKRQEAIAKAELARESERLVDQEDEDAQDDEKEEDSGETGARGSADTDGSAPSKMQGGVLQPSLALSKQSFQSSRLEAPKSVSQSTAVSASVRSVVSGVFMDWPCPPRDASGTGQVRCPYCFDLLDKQEMGSKNRWRKHVKKDLEPYGCFYRECNQALLKMFASEAKWIGHIRAAHTSGGTWVCRMMPHKSAPGAVVVLSTEDEFKKHLESEHTGMYPKSRIETMARGAYRPHQAKVEDMFRDECPMRCPASLDESPETAIVLGVPHITNHLLSLALQALPERSVRSSESGFTSDKNSDDDNDGGNDDAGKSLKRVVRGTIRDGLETLPDPSFEDPSDSPTTRAEQDTNLRMSGDRLEFYGYLPLVHRQHGELTELDQAQDPTMESFIKQQLGVEDLPFLRGELVQREARRRVAGRNWTSVIIPLKFLHRVGAFSAKNKRGLADPEEEKDVKKTSNNMEAVLEQRLAELRRDLAQMLTQKGEYEGMMDELKDKERPGAGFEFRRVENSLNQTEKEIWRLRSEIQKVKSEILEAEEVALVPDEDGISSMAGEGKLKKRSERATSGTGSQPALYVSTSRRSGKVNFERLGLISTSQPLVRVGAGKIGKVEFDIRLLFSKTKWGVMGDAGIPAAIIYMDFDVRVSNDSALRSWRVEISLQEEISEKSKPKGVNHQVLGFTEFYGPKKLAGSRYTTSRVTRFTPTVEFPGSGAGGVGVERESRTELPLWRFDGYLSSSPRSPFYDTLAWEMENSKTAPSYARDNRYHNNIFHVAFAIQHNAHEFCLRTSVTGRLASSSQDRFRRLWKFPNTKDSDEMMTKFQFPSRESYLSANTMALDRLAQGLPLAMELENMNKLPMELPMQLPQSRPLELTKSPNYPPFQPPSLYSSALPASSSEPQQDMQGPSLEPRRLAYSKLSEPGAKTRRENTTNNPGREESQSEEEDEEYFTGVEDADED